MKKIQSLKTYYSNLFLQKKKFYFLKKNGILFSYVIFFKRIYFVRISGTILRNNKKQHSINQTLNIFSQIKKETLMFNIPTQSKAIVIFQ